MSPPKLPPKCRALLKVLDGKELSTTELLEALGLKDRKSFKKLYIDAAVAAGLVEPLFDNPHHPGQKYRLTEKGK